MTFDLNHSTLGKKISTPEKYDASLLFRIPRSENRVHYELNSANLPFVGFDVWNCYEVSFLTDNGLPVSRVLKLVYPADSEFLVESKSLKLYLNSFNMDCFGKTMMEAEKQVLKLISNDLTRLLETKLSVSFFESSSQSSPVSLEFSKDLISMISISELESIRFNHFTETPELLGSKVSNSLNSYSFHTDLLRSNCRVTNQPDWGDLIVQLSTMHEIDFRSVIEYIVSFRRENHFHEEVVEMIYKRFWDIFQPEKLVVMAMYTRRGGIDINPVRASHPELIDQTLINPNIRVAKTLRQ